MAPFPWDCKLERATVQPPGSGTFPTIPSAHPCPAHLQAFTSHPLNPKSCNDPRDPASLHPTAFNPSSGIRLGELGIFCRNSTGRNPKHRRAAPVRHTALCNAHPWVSPDRPPPPQWGVQPCTPIPQPEHPSSFSHRRDATPPSPHRSRFLPSLPRITGKGMGGPGVAGGARGQPPH